jgi:hypothetical protein
MDGPREVPDWVPGEEIVIGHGTVPEIESDDDATGERKPAMNGTVLVEGVGMVNLDDPRHRLNEATASEVPQAEATAAS